jgi:alpha-tubulin suppressor-like RCC1 family protein
MANHTNSEQQVLIAQPVGFLTSGSRVAAGWSNSVAVPPSGDVISWGQGNAWGRFGTETSTSTLPVATKLPVGAVAVGAGRDHSFALSADGGGWACGQNDWHTVGDATSTDRFVPFTCTPVRPRKHRHDDRRACPDGP